jgi:hypothetical protein
MPRQMSHADTVKVVYTHDSVWNSMCDFRFSVRLHVRSTVDFFFKVYPLILSFKTINKLKLSLECGIPRPQDAGHLCFRLFS